MLTLRQLWDDFQRTAVIAGVETPHEIALQKYGFLCGAMAAAGTLAAGVELDADDAEALIDEASADLRLEADRDRISPSSN